VNLGSQYTVEEALYGFQSPVDRCERGTTQREEKEEEIHNKTGLHTPLAERKEKGMGKTK